MMTMTLFLETMGLRNSKLQKGNCRKREETSFHTESL